MYTKLSAYSFLEIYFRPNSPRAQIYVVIRYIVCVNFSWFLSFVKFSTDWKLYHMVNFLREAVYLKFCVLRVHESLSITKKSPRKICRPKLSAYTNLKVVDQTLRGKIYGLPATLVFAACGAFETCVLSPWPHEVKIIKLNEDTEPPHEANTLLCTGRFLSTVIKQRVCVASQIFVDLRVDLSSQL